MKKLYRSETNKRIAGVCGGIGEMLNVDPTIMRVAARCACTYNRDFAFGCRLHYRVGGLSRWKTRNGTKLQYSSEQVVSACFT